MKRVLTTFLSLMSISYTAQASVQALTPWQDLLDSEKTKLQTVRKASVSFDVENGLNCTGTFISKDGHILTAHHCLGQCLSKALAAKGVDTRKYFDAQSRYLIRLADGSAKTFTLDEYRNFLEAGGNEDDTIAFETHVPEDLKGLRCKAMINGKSHTVTFLGTGRGSVWPFFARHLEKASAHMIPEWKRLVDDGFGQSADFALLKAELKNTACLSVSKTAAKSGEILKTLSATIVDGYSQPKERLGQTAFFSSAPEETELLSNLRPELSPTIFKHAQLDASEGSSGSAVIGQDSTIKGILVQTAARGTREKLIRVSTFIDMQFITKVLQQTWKVQLPSCK